MELEKRLGLGGSRDVFIPREGVDMEKWCCIAADQHTSEPEYWAQAEQFVGECPSTLKLIVPEAYLGEDEEQHVRRVKGTHEAMRKYVEDGVLRTVRWPLFVDRYVLEKHRLGVVVALDLECYDFRAGTSTLARPTEGTIVERLPARMEVRREAIFEMPHILLLIDDPENTVVEPVAKYVRESGAKPVYSTDLMLGGGHIEGFEVDQKGEEMMFKALDALLDPELQVKRYGPNARENPLLYAMGDGNHSLASAKMVWEELKAKGADPATHPARYALVEINNIHEESLVFEPIHRVFDGEDIAKFYGLLEAKFPGMVSFEEMTKEDMLAHVQKHGNAKPFKMGYVSKEKTGVLCIRSDADATLVLSVLQPALDEIVRENKINIDYIHDDDVTCSMGLEEGRVAILLPTMVKSDLFIEVVQSAVVPRKTFSMGHACEKRYYLELRKIQ